MLIGGVEGTLGCFEINGLGWKVGSQRRTREQVDALPFSAVVSWLVVFQPAEPNQIEASVTKV